MLPYFEKFLSKKSNSVKIELNQMIQVYGSLLKKQKLDYLLGRKKNVNGNYQPLYYQIFTIWNYYRFFVTSKSINIFL